MVSSTQQAITGYATKIARTNIVELLPYHCARDDYSTGILLDANENAYGSPVSVPSSLTTTTTSSSSNGTSSNGTNTSSSSMMQLERYPDPYQIPLKEAICNYRNTNNQDPNNNTINIRPENVFVGVGSDEAIDLLMRIFCKPGIDSILITPPTYGMYKVCAKVNDISIVECPLTPEFDLRIQDVCFCFTNLFFIHISL
jgi:histidinol-phosphate aminotransferase